VKSPASAPPRSAARRRSSAMTSPPHGPATSHTAAHPGYQVARS
jgi:hypothetical protein